MKSDLTQSILIVGGGTSGWLCAAYLARQLGSPNNGGPSITLIEASDIPTIGVGEATIPPIRSAIAACGLSEAEFFRATKGSFKLAIRFDGWRESPTEKEHRFYHAFGQHGRVGHEPLAPYWLVNAADKQFSFVNYTMNNGPIIEAMRGPKRATDPEFGGPLDYAYHFDAGLLAELLKKKAKANGVRHIIGTIEHVSHDRQNIQSVRTSDGETLETDLFVDCSGFHAKLIEKSLREPFVSMADVLFCDSAIACQVPYPTQDTPIPPYTKSVARESGWIWDVPLQHRRGTGFVFSSRHIDEDQAKQVLLDYIGDAGEGANPRALKFRVGYRENPWRGNCVAIGLSGGFVEPLESTGIYVSDIAVRWLTDFCLPKAQYQEAAKAFNKRMTECYRDIIDFVKLHYVLSDRNDRFWTENRDPESIPDSLRAKLAMWRHRLPSEYEFGHLPAVFSFSNYIQIMMGMGFHPNRNMLASRYRQSEKATQISQQLGKVSQSGLEVLPEHRALLEQLASKA